MFTYLNEDTYKTHITFKVIMLKSFKETKKHVSKCSIDCIRHKYTFKYF